MDPKTNFDLFREKLDNYAMRTFNKPGDVVAIVRDMEDPRSTFKNKHIPKDLTEDQENSWVQKSIQEKNIKVFVFIEMKIQSNLQRIYGLIWVQCTYYLQYLIQNYEACDNKQIYFDFVWLLKNLKLIESSLYIKRSKLFNYHEVIMIF